MTICNWIISKGGPNNLTLSNVFEIVDCYLFQYPPSGYSFIPTITQVFGIIDYYLGFDGDSGTGCNFSLTCEERNTESDCLMYGCYWYDNSCHTYPQQSGVKAFPGAEGFGTNTRHAYAGGSNPTVYKVTNLNNSGPGSLRHALEASGPRVVVFEVSGYIDLQPSPEDGRYCIIINNPYLFVAGQTAPSPGICTRGGPIVVSTHDVVFQHMAMRAGDLPGGSTYEDRDSIDAHNWYDGNVYNVVFDHLSCSWTTDEIMHTWYDTQNMTWQYCLLAEPLACPMHPKGPHPFAVCIGPESLNNSFHHNVIIDSSYRNPLVEPKGYTEVVNNYIYNWKWEASDFIWYPYEQYHCDSPGPKFCNIIGNYYKEGNDVIDEICIGIYKDQPPSLFYVYDNIGPAVDGPGRPTGTEPQWDIVYHGSWGEDDMKSLTPLFQSEVTTHTAFWVRDNLLFKAGARPADRDAVDTRVVQNAINGTGGIITSQEDVGGFPSLAQNTRTLTIPNNPHVDSGNGYTNLEVWLHNYALAVEN